MKNGEYKLNRKCNRCKHPSSRYRIEDSYVFENCWLTCINCGCSGEYFRDELDKYIVPLCTSPELKDKDRNPIGENPISHEDIALMRWELAKRGKIKARARKLK